MIKQDFYYDLKYPFSRLTSVMTRYYANFSSIQLSVFRSPNVPSGSRRTETTNAFAGYVSICSLIQLGRSKRHCLDNNLKLLKVIHKKKLDKK